jgi:FdhD protein
MGQRTSKVLTRRLRAGELRRAPDELAVEEPLAIELDGTLVTTTMRTPGHDFELAAGFCHSEGLLARAAVRSCRYCAHGSGAETGYNVVTVDTGGVAPPPTPRLGLTTSACGLCGSATLTDLQLRLDPLPVTPPIGLDVLASMPERVRSRQELFDRTGAVHAAAAFDRDGEVLLVREDVGRHNALDKVVGRLLLDGRLPAHGLGLFVSGRASYELAQKAWSAGFAALVAVSAPSSLAVTVARAARLTLAGFAREGQLNIYSPDPSDGTPAPAARPALAGPADESSRPPQPS